jgi:hypothetical protein
MKSQLVFLAILSLLLLAANAQDRQKPMVYEPFSQEEVKEVVVPVAVETETIEEPIRGPHYNHRDPHRKSPRADTYTPEGII